MENPNGSILLKCSVLRIHGAHFYQGRVQRTELTWHNPEYDAKTVKLPKYCFVISGSETE